MSRLLRRLWFWCGRIGFWFCWPLIYIIIGRSQRARVVIRHHDDILLVRPWLSSGTWQLPGGGIHRAEPAVNAALREVREETGITLSEHQLQTLGEPLGVSEVGVPYQAQMYEARLSEKPRVKKAQIEIFDYMWAPLNQLETLNVSSSTKQARALIEIPS